jgi:hypothetical protein
MDTIKFTSGQYRLCRIADGMGDSGRMLLALNPQTGSPENTENGVIKVGERIICGSHYARSYQFQDWWCCTAVKKIKEVYGTGDNKCALIETETGKEYFVGDCEAVTERFIAINDLSELDE